MTNLLLAFLLIFLVQTSFAQREKFEFTEGLCLSCQSPYFSWRT